jgi:hypothetical protein
MPGLAIAVRSVIAFFVRSLSGRRLRSTAASAWSASSSASARCSLSSIPSSSALRTPASVPSQPYSRASLRRRSKALSSPSIRLEKWLALAASTRLASAPWVARSAIPRRSRSDSSSSSSRPGSSAVAGCSPASTCAIRLASAALPPPSWPASRSEPRSPVSGARSSSSSPSSSSLSPVRLRMPARVSPIRLGRCQAYDGPRFISSSASVATRNASASFGRAL